MLVFSVLIGTLVVAVSETRETGIVAIKLPVSENRVEGNRQGEWKFNRDRS